MPKTEFSLNEHDHLIAKLAAMAIVLHVAEAVFPSPLPGLKPGVANIVTLYALYRYDFIVAAWVSILRVVASSLILGQFLSPTFALSLSGTTCAVLALLFAQHLPRRYFSALSLSLITAFAHILGQFLVVRLWLIPNNGVFYLAPIFAVVALIFGTINGIIVEKLLARMRV